MCGSITAMLSNIMGTRPAIRSGRAAALPL
ncbi:Uncharacterised protein [Bordetella pertussis]|nr:Uncharacterised protein [Bordetella pertussis]